MFLYRGEPWISFAPAWLHLKASINWQPTNPQVLQFYCDVRFPLTKKYAKAKTYKFGEFEVTLKLFDPIHQVETVFAPWLP